MTIDAWQVAAGALTGLVVGMTGVGGGALMTPILLLGFGTAPLVAVGTDLWFAAITKLAVSGLHVRQRLIDWPVVTHLWLGSLPASLLTLLWLANWQANDGAVALVKAAIAIAVSVTAVSLLVGQPLRAPGARLSASAPSSAAIEWPAAATVAAGALLGVMVTLTSIGAGALGVVMLVHLYPRLAPPRLVASDIAHAIPLALCAGVGHLALGGIDLALLGNLLAGSIPAALVGAAVSSRVPHAVLRAVLGAVLLVIGLTMLRAAM
ncbi:MAG: sulfite exporter TauE/SafE family protein [Acidobacteriota bacterium]|nr:sulfite exporter TauE/SafE family protein [Acidobacteriota bacterium]